MSWTNITIHAGASTSKRRPILAVQLDEILRSAAYEALKNLACYPLAFGAWNDHFHIAFGLDISHSVDEVMDAVKDALTEALTAEGVRDCGFQTGHWSLSVSRSDVRRTVAYVENQRERHGGAEFTLEDEWKRRFE